MKKIQYFAVCACVGLIAGCSTTTNKAPVVDKSNVDNRRIESPVTVVAPPSVSKPIADTRGTYVVKKGDTLYRIALDHGQSYSDIVAWNNLSNPNDIKVDQVLRVAPPDNGAAVQVSGVAAPPAVEARPITQMNSALNKNSPRGDKKAYSEANLAELQKTDTGVTVIAPVAVKTDMAAKTDAKPAAASVVVEPEKIDWGWPADGKVTAGFDDVRNKGLDIAGKSGQAIFAAAAGKVMYVGSAIRGYGNLVIIRHTNDLLSAYAHNKQILVKDGQSITKGQKIAEMGDSDTDTVKLHFEIRQQGKPVDPSKYLPSR